RLVGMAVQGQGRLAQGQVRQGEILRQRRVALPARRRPLPADAAARREKRPARLRRPTEGQAPDPGTHRRRKEGDATRRRQPAVAKQKGRWVVALFSPGGAAVNSQGRQPLERAVPNISLSPGGRNKSSRGSVSPLRGFGPYGIAAVQGR